MRAKDLTMYELGQIGHLFTTLPWGVSEFESARRLMGQAYWSKAAKQYNVKPSE